MAGFDADLIIIGAGPAGLTAAQYGARANLKTLVIERLSVGGQTLAIDVLENFPGNAGQFDTAGEMIAEPKSGFEFVMDLHRQAENFGASFYYGKADSINKEGNIFTVVMADGNVRTAAAVIIATGSSPRLLDIPGEKEFTGKGVSYCATCDGNFFKGKKIFVAGGGDAACDEARYLSRLTDRVVLVHRRDSFRAQKALAQRTIDNPKIDVRFNTVIKKIRGLTALDIPLLEGRAFSSMDKVNSVVLMNTINGEYYEEDADAVFIFVGTVPQSSLVSGENLKADMDESGYIITDQKMATNIPGLYAAGDIRSGAFRQVVTACADGAVAAHNAAGYIDEI